MKSLNSKWARTAIFIAAGVIVSEFATFLIAYLNNYKVADLGGYYYVRIVAPAVGIAVALAALLISNTVRQKSFTFYPPVLLIVSIVAFHTLIFVSGYMPGYYVMPRDLNLETMDDGALLHYTDSVNDELRWQAIYAILDRAKHDPSLAWQLLQKQKSQGSQYFDSAITISIVEVLSKLRDPKIIPVLEEMLASKEQVLIVENGATKISYPTRKLAKRLLSTYFGKKIDVVTEESY